VKLGAPARRRLGIVAIALSVAGASTAGAAHLASDTEGHTTLEQVLTGNGTDFRTLSVEAVDEDYVVREPSGATAQAGRETRRTSLAYFGQLSDFQLADEESPARVEFVDPGASSAWRPQEAFHPFVVDATIRQMNNFAPASPVPQGDTTGNSMDFVLTTGDQADNQQRNEVTWVRELLEGGTPTSFGSGASDPAFYSPMNPDFVSKPSCPAFLAQEGGSAAAAAAEGAAYTGVQDYDDYPAAMPPGPQPAYYDPDQPLGQWSTWPQWTGLLDRAQQPFTPAGLDVPSYWANGNHDVLVQGNEDANAAFEDIVTACFKALGTTLQIPPTPPGPDFVPDPNLLLAPTAAGMLVPPDPMRRFVSKQQLKAVLGANDVDDDHGFEFVDPAEVAASNDSASYYAWDPPQTPGFRFITLDTNSEGGQTAEGVASGSANGNIDDPQFEWLRAELDAAQAADKLIVLFGHHPIRSMTTLIADEQASPCTVNDMHPDTPPHDVNPGCDSDPRVSTPVHPGADLAPGDPRESLVELLAGYPNVISYVAGHTHENRLLPCGQAAGCGANPVWWEINTAATADWPQQSRLVEVMDNEDGTLSIFGTVIDSEQPAAAPPAGPAAAFTPDQLASVGRTIAFNDPQGGEGTGEGGPEDQNAEMLLPDPRDADLAVTKTDNADPVVAGNQLAYTVVVDNNGPTDAPLTTLTDQLPPTTSFVSAVPTQGTCGHAGGQVNCSLGTIDSGDDATVVITVATQTAGTISNTASATGPLTDPVPANNTDTEQTTVNPIPATSADLAIAKTGSPANPLVGDQLTYTLAVTNNGPDPATGVAITDALPAGLSFVSASASQGSCANQAGTVTCNLGGLADDATATATIRVTPQTAGAVTNNASVAGAQIDPVAANNSDGETTQVDPRPVQAPDGSGFTTCARARATLTGTASRDKLTGTPGRDVIVALGGNDRVNGRAGNDLICGGPGRDRLNGGPGTDQLRGQSGHDRLKGGKGKDLLRGGGGRDRCAGGTRRSCLHPRR
jgi:uncharacterized repeat protein (TIGR01451 family)